MTVEAPFPGNITGVNVSVGDSVEEGQILGILEAMKMDNEIVAPSSGTVSAVNVKKGDSVETDDVLFTIG